VREKEDWLCTFCIIDNTFLENLYFLKLDKEFIYYQRWVCDNLLIRA
jgi:hypothetical protein